MKYLSKILYFLIITLLISVNVYATHNRGGEITYRQISELTYEITLKTYTYTISAADRPDLEIQWGDNTSSIVPRNSEVFLPDNYKCNTYIGTHTYPGPGTYQIVMEDQNRNEGILNIPGSVNVPFTVKTILQINPNLGYNNTPVLLVPPLDKACTHQIFIHNPSAYDSDGDSLAYKLSLCLGENGTVIPGYTVPPSTDSIKVNALTGDLVWNAPTQAGKYNVAIIIEEYRHNIKIGSILRDMQIDVSNCSYSPPKIKPLNDICVEAGDTVTFKVEATDAANYNLLLTASGGPLLQSLSHATFDSTYGHSYVSRIFNWKTHCIHVRKFPYQVVFKVEERNAPTNLVDMVAMNIKVVSPSPKNLILTPTNNSINVSWSSCICQQATAYEIYRKDSPSGFIPDSCQTGVPASTGFVKIKTVQGINNTYYLDNNNGLGLTQGYEYCYRIVALFADSAESYSSDEVCTDLVRGIPIITNVSVNYTDSVNGSMYVAWAKPTEFDTSYAQGPYKYLIYRSNDLWGQNFVLIDSLNNINDTTYTDTLINTLNSPYSYKIEFYNDSLGNRFLIGSPQIASSVYLTIGYADKKLILNFNKNVPWINSSYTIYRKNELPNSFDTLGTTSATSYIDYSLVNGHNYCYLVKSNGSYPVPRLVNPIINYSQENCGTPKDTAAPCPPVLKVESFCDNFYNYLTWTNPNHYCCNDVVKYNIYYSYNLSAPYQLLRTINFSNDTTFQHIPDDSTGSYKPIVISMSGCYVITAIDSFNNESRYSNKVCVDICKNYELPNIFTPNGDNLNDLYRPGKYYNVNKIDLNIFNRWGNLVFHTTNPDVLWDGKITGTNELVTDGVYYYNCDVYEYRLSGIETRHITGFVHVITKGGAKK